MVKELQEMQGKVQALAAEKKMEEAKKMQEDLVAKHAVYTAKDAEFKTKVAELTEQQSQLKQTMRLMEIQFGCHEDMAKIYQIQVDDVNQ